MMKVIVICFVCLLATVGKVAASTPEIVYIETALGDTADAKVLWLTPDIQAQINELIGHKYMSARVRYWAHGSMQVWILNEIGKEKNITAGFTLKNGQIIDTQVLVFRESRGWQIKHQAFTDQFVNVSLTDTQALSKSIDGISGATLSVKAMQKMAKLALYLTTQTTPGTP